MRCESRFEVAASGAVLLLSTYLVLSSLSGAALTSARNGHTSSSAEPATCQLSPRAAASDPCKHSRETTVPKFRALKHASRAERERERELRSRRLLHQPRPSCRCSVPRSWIWDVSSTSRPSATTPRGRCLQSMSPRGTVSVMASIAAQGNKLTRWLLQTSPPIHHQKHQSTGEDESGGPAAADPDALLYPAYTDPRPVSTRRKGARYLQRLQAVQSMFGRNLGQILTCS